MHELTLPRHGYMHVWPKREIVQVVRQYLLIRRQSETNHQNQSLHNVAPKIMINYRGGIAILGDDSLSGFGDT
jgi:hypothetical protein